MSDRTYKILGIVVFILAFTIPLLIGNSVTEYIGTYWPTS